MNTYIHLPQDLRQGIRIIEINKDGQTMVLTEQELEQAWDQMQAAPLDKEQEKEDMKDEMIEDEVNEIIAEKYEN